MRPDSLDCKKATCDDLDDVLDEHWENGTSDEIEDLRDWYRENCLGI